MEKTEKKLSGWKGKTGRNGLYRIHYGEPLTVREIAALGMHSSALRAFLCTLVFTAAQIAFSVHTYQILHFLKKTDLILLIGGLIILAASFVAGKKFGRGYAIIFKWIGMPMVFFGVMAFGLVRLGLAAFWVMPVDLFMGARAQEILQQGEGFAAFRSLLQWTANLKGTLLGGDMTVSIFTSLMEMYRRISSSMNYYAVIPVLVLISLGVFLLTLLLVNFCGIITLIFPIAACYWLTRLMNLLDRKF